MNQNEQNTQQPSQWTDVTGGNFGTPWKPQASEENGMSYNPQNPYNVLEGYLLKITDGIPTRYETPMTLYSIQTVNPDGSLGAVYSLVEDKFLSDKVRAIELNKYIRIEYKGRTLKKNLPPQNWSKTNSYHTWGVAVNYNAPHLSSLKPSPVAPAQNQAPVQNQGQRAGASGPFYPAQQQQAPVQRQVAAPAQNQQQWPQSPPSAAPAQQQTQQWPAQNNQMPAAPVPAQSQQWPQQQQTQQWPQTTQQGNFSPPPAQAPIQQQTWTPPAPQQGNFSPPPAQAPAPGFNTSPFPENDDLPF